MSIHIKLIDSLFQNFVSTMIYPEHLNVATSLVQNYYSDFSSRPIRIFAAFGYVFGLYNRFTSGDPTSTKTNAAERTLSKF